MDSIFLVMAESREWEHPVVYFKNKIEAEEYCEKHKDDYKGVYYYVEEVEHGS